MSSAAKTRGVFAAFSAVVLYVGDLIALAVGLAPSVQGSAPILMAAGFMLVIQLPCAWSAIFLLDRYVKPVFDRWVERRGQEWWQRHKHEMPGFDRPPWEMSLEEVEQRCDVAVSATWMRVHKRLTECPGGKVRHAGLFRPKSLRSWRYGIQYCDFCGKMKDGRKVRKVIS